MDICRHFTDISWGWSIDQGNDICVLYQSMGRGVVVNEDVLESLGPEREINGME